MLKIIHSEKSKSAYTVTGEKNRATIQVSGEACENAKVKAELKRIHTVACDWDTAEWTARMLSKTY